jgi:hypothetical protein
MVSYSIEQLAEQIVGPGFYLKNKGSTRAVEICEVVLKSGTSGRTIPLTIPSAT